jgi:hypothetical protein
MPKDDSATALTAAGEPAERSVPRFEVELLKHHTHAGQDLLPGAKIKITAEQRTWLKSLGVIAGETPEK